MNKKRNHSFNWLKRNLRNSGLEYTLSMGSPHAIFLSSPIFYTLLQDSSNPNYFTISHPDCFGTFSISISHNYNFPAFIDKLLRYEQMFQKHIYQRMSIRQKVGLWENPELGKSTGRLFNI